MADTTEKFSEYNQNVLGEIKGEPLEKRDPLYTKKISELAPLSIKSAVGLEREKEKREINVREGAAEEGQRQTVLQETELKEGIEKRDKYSLPTFKPTQEDLSTYSQLGSSIMTLGIMLGTGGKVPATMAINAMTGMLNGWRQGRKDLYEKESKAFDKEFARIGAIRKDIQNDISNAMRLWPTKRKDAIALIETARYKAGTESILGKMLYKGNIDGTIKILESAAKTDAASLKHKQDMDFKKAQTDAKAAADERRHRESMKQRESLAKIRAEKGGSGLLKPGAEVTKNYLGQNALMSDMQDISNDLKKPAIRKLIKDYRLESFASEELGKIVAQISNDELPSELRKFLVKVRNVRNNYYLSISGKAVTGGEALRNYGVIPQPGDSAEFMSDKVESVISQINRTILQNQKLYGLPPIDTATLNTFRAEKPDSTFDVRSLDINDQDSSGLESSIRSAFGEYDPKKYDYRRDPNTGQMQRKAKAQE